MELFLLGFNGLLLLAVWHFMLRKSILDDHRDRLFDLRDHLRAKFVQEGWSMDQPIYRKLRDLINSYLRFTESYSFTAFMLMERSVLKNPALQARLKKDIDAEFKPAHQGQADFIKCFRIHAVKVMMSYMIVSSGPLILLTVACTPLIACVQLVKWLEKGIRKSGGPFFTKAIEFRSMCLAFMKFVIALIASKLIYDEFVEEYSYKIA